MPIRPRKEIANRAPGGPSPAQLDDLLHGYAFFEDPFKTADERRACWRKHRTFILSLQGKTALDGGEYFALGTRPHAWWTFDAPGPRQFIACTNSWCPFFAGCPVVQNIPTGSPACLIRAGDDRTGKGSFDGLYKIECVGHAFRIYLPTRETEADFLRRHGLLNAVELAAIPAPSPMRDEEGEA